MKKQKIEKSPFDILKEYTINKKIVDIRTSQIGPTSTIRIVLDCGGYLDLFQDTSTFSRFSQLNYKLTRKEDILEKLEMELSEKKECLNKLEKEYELINSLGK